MKPAILLFFILFSGFANSQNRNSIWCFGDSAGIDFRNTGNPVPIFTSLDTRGSCVSIADSSGNLLFYANTRAGIFPPSGRIWDSTNHLMQNGDSIAGEGWYNEMIILPYPGSNSLYYLFCVDVTGGANYYGFYYSLIDMTQNGGLGGVVQKNVRLDTVPMYDAMAAVKHANGRDWWLVAKDYATFNYSNTFHLYLITPDTIRYATQSIGGVSLANGANMTFSKDGTKFLFTTYHELIEVLNFDRCSGIFSNPVVIKPERAPLWYGSLGSAFSPDGNVIYVSISDSVSKVYQYDLTATNIPASRFTVATFSSNFFSAGALRLAPDDKIYLSNIYYDGINFPYPYPDSVRNVYNENLSVINNPDVTGAGCNFTPYSFYLGGKRTYKGLPNNPNYDMEAQGGTVCDSLGLPNAILNPVVAIHKGVIYPNPANYRMFYAYSLRDGEKGVLEICNALGMVVAFYTLDAKSNLLDINCDQLQPAVYYAKVTVDNVIIQKEKLVIVK